MKLLIRYYTKHGSAREMANRLAQELHADVMDISEKADSAAYDKILYICAVYIGRMNKAMIRDIQFSMHPDLGLCLVGLNKNDAQKTAQENLKGDVDKLSMITGIGGVLNFPEMSFMERKIISMVNKEKKMLDTIDTKKVYELWEEERIIKMKEWASV